MSVLTLVRHAQASLFAADYDELSELGREQARLLGDFWVRRAMDFDEVYCGPRVRQKQTAEVVGSVYARAERAWPQPVVLPELDEYDFGSLLSNLAPLLAERDAVFAELLARHRRDESGPDRVRNFQKMLTALTLYWATASDEVEGVELFAAFRERVARGLRRVTEAPGAGRRGVMFTSAGFIGTSVRLALDAPDRMALEVNGRVRNCSLTEFVFTKDRLTLDGFNAIPHLPDPALWTYW